METTSTKTYEGYRKLAQLVFRFSVFTATVQVLGVKTGLEDMDDTGLVMAMKQRSQECP